MIRKILLASRRPFYPLRLGGAARSSHQLIQHLITNHPIEVRVVSRLDASVNFSEKVRVALGISAWRESPGKLTVDCGYSVQFVDDFEAGLEEMLSEFSPALVWSQLDDAAATLSRCRQHGVPGVLYIRDAGFDARTIADAHSAGVVIVCNSRYLVEKIKHDAGVNAWLAYSINNEPLGVTGDPEGVCTMVNPVAKKGFGTLLDIVAVLPETRFVVYASRLLPPEKLTKLNQICQT